MDKQSAQTEFNRLTNRGIILGYVWILGAGSLISLISAYQAKKLFDTSDYKLEGRNKITKCVIIGIAGLLVWAIAIAIIIIFKKK